MGALITSIHSCQEKLHKNCIFAKFSTRSDKAVVGIICILEGTKSLFTKKKFLHHYHKDLVKLPVCCAEEQRKVNSSLQKSVENAYKSMIYYAAKFSFVIWAEQNGKAPEMER